MIKNNINLDNETKNRISLYEEICKFLSLEGYFEADKFSQLIREHFNELKGNYPDAELFLKHGEMWISEYLAEIMEYLDTKGMPVVCTDLFIVALGEARDVGIQRISLPPDLLRGVFVNTAQGASPGESHRDREPGDKKREKIFNAAIQVFSEEGFHRATIDKIASLSGIAKGSVYRHFKSKEDLRDQLLDEKCQEIVTAIRTIIENEDNVLGQIQQMIEFWIAFIEKNHVLYRLIQSESIFQRSGERVMFYDFLISHLPMFKERIVALNRDRKLKTTSFYTVFYGILGFIDGVVHKWFRSGMKYPLSQEVPIILEVLFNGFVGENETRKRFNTPPDEKKEAPAPGNDQPKVN